MPCSNNSCMASNKHSKPQEVVSIPVPLFKSLEGKYFVGQTENLNIECGSNAWAGLVNPHDSGVDLYVNVFTISNFSDEYLTAEIWLNTKVPEGSIISHKVSPTNTAIKPLPKNKVNIRFAKSVNPVHKSGVNVYERIVPPKTTLVAEEDGKFIEAPSGDYVVIIKSSSKKTVNVVVAFGWYEKKKSIICK